MPRFLRLASLACAVALTSAAPALAQNAASVTAAEALFEEGRAAMAAGDLVTACGRFRESDRLDPAPGTRLNLADCEEKRGRLAMAWSLFRSAADQLEPSDDRLPVARERLAALEDRVPRLKLTLGPGAPHDTVVSIAGAELKAGSFGVPLPFDPGRYRIEVRAPGHEARVFTKELQAGEQGEVVIAPGPSRARPEEAGAEAQSGATTRGSTRGLVYVLAGVGSAGVVAGTLSGIMTLEKKSLADRNCNDELAVCNQAGKDANASGQLYGTISVVGFAIGALGLGGAAYFLLSESGEGAPSVSAGIGPGSGVVSFRQSF